MLSKFGKQHTIVKGGEELKRIMTTDITDNERMVIFLTCLSEINEHMNLNQMKEQIKQFGVAAEIFEEALVPFLPKLMSNFAKRIKEEGSPRLHGVISETIGQLVFNIVDKIEDANQQDQAYEEQFLKMPFGLLEKRQNKVVQAGAIACLTKIVINCPDDILY